MIDLFKNNPPYIGLVISWIGFIFSDQLIYSFGKNRLELWGSKLTDFNIKVALFFLALFIVLAFMAFYHARKQLMNTRGFKKNNKTHRVFLYISTFSIGLFILSAVLSIALWGRFPGGMLG